MMCNVDQLTVVKRFSWTSKFSLMANSIVSKVPRLCSGWGPNTSLAGSNYYLVMCAFVFVAIGD